MEYIIMNNFRADTYNIEYKFQVKHVLSFVPIMACWNKSV